ncbi:hypothetical protein [Streptomyces sp. NPDC090798]|uniref:hypothetical protein n=1 Tax=Streptomyces sp. NPDC090798 TaxID=3365968 RepID=UPI0038270C08
MAAALKDPGPPLFGGPIADLWGRKRTFVTGLICFAGASAHGGAAQGEAMMLGARALQGAGANSGPVMARDIPPAANGPCCVTACSGSRTARTPRIQFVHAFADSGLAGSGRPEHRADPAVPHNRAAAPIKQSTLPIVQLRKQHPRLPRGLITEVFRTRVRSA